MSYMSYHAYLINCSLSQLVEFLNIFIFIILLETSEMLPIIVWERLLQACGLCQTQLMTWGKSDSVLFI